MRRPDIDAVREMVRRRLAAVAGGFEEARCRTRARLVEKGVAPGEGIEALMEEVRRQLATRGGGGWIMGEVFTVEG